jgi:hypothetical protein
MELESAGALSDELGAAIDAGVAELLRKPTLDELRRIVVAANKLQRAAAEHQRAGGPAAMN